MSNDLLAGYAAALESDAGFQQAMASTTRQGLGGDRTTADRALRAAAMRVLWERIRGLWAGGAVTPPREIRVRLASG
jgi:hypothetical protein